MRGNHRIGANTSRAAQLMAFGLMAETDVAVLALGDIAKWFLFGMDKLAYTLRNGSIGEWFEEFVEEFDEYGGKLREALIGNGVPADKADEIVNKLGEYLHSLRDVGDMGETPETRSPYDPSHFPCCNRVHVQRNDGETIVVLVPRIIESVDAVSYVFDTPFADADSFQVRRTAREILFTASVSVPLVQVGDTTFDEPLMNVHYQGTARLVDGGIISPFPVAIPNAPLPPDLSPELAPLYAQFNRLRESQQQAAEPAVVYNPIKGTFTITVPRQIESDLTSKVMVNDQSEGPAPGSADEGHGDATPDAPATKPVAQPAPEADTNAAPTNNG